MNKIALSILAALAVDMNSAHADEQLRVLATGGNWVASSHAPNMSAPADICIIFNPLNGLGVRSSEEGTEFRVANEQWSLPVDVSGNMSLSVGGYSKTLAIGSNTATALAAPITNEDLLSLFAAMNKATTMLVTVGKAKPISVSLAGSTRVTNAFLNCANIRGGTSAPGSNPFQ